MASPNLNMRDPVIYRIMHAEHHRTGNKWCVYPMYDFAHPLSDAAEKVTHSLCTLEFEDHRPLYDWVLRECEIENPPRQIEFARMNLNYNAYQQEKVSQAGERRICKRMGRPAHGDDLRSKAQRISGRRNTRFLRENRRVEGQQRHRLCAPRGVCKGQPQRKCSAHNGGSAPRSR